MPITFLPTWPEAAVSSMRVTVISILIGAAPALQAARPMITDDARIVDANYDKPRFIGFDIEKFCCATRS